MDGFVIAVHPATIVEKEVLCANAAAARFSITSPPRDEYLKPVYTGANALPLDPLLWEARTFAQKAHGTQMYGEHEYVYHLDHVVGMALSAGCRPDTDRDVLVGLYFHDLVEDTDVSLDEIKDWCVARGVRAAHIVEGMTDINKEPNWGRLTVCSDSLLGKLADRAANMSQNIIETGKIRTKYLSQQVIFERDIYSDTHIEQIIRLQRRIRQLCIM